MAGVKELPEEGIAVAHQLPTARSLGGLPRPPIPTPPHQPHEVSKASEFLQAHHPGCMVRNLLVAYIPGAVAWGEHPASFTATVPTDLRCLRIMGLWRILGPMVVPAGLASGVALNEHSNPGTGSHPDSSSHLGKQVAVCPGNLLLRQRSSSFGAEQNSAKDDSLAHIMHCLSFYVAH